MFPLKFLSVLLTCGVAETSGVVQIAQGTKVLFWVNFQSSQSGCMIAMEGLSPQFQFKLQQQEEINVITYSIDNQNAFFSW